MIRRTVFTLSILMYVCTVFAPILFAQNGAAKDFAAKSFAIKPPVIQSGHIGPVNRIVNSAEHGILFSCGDDGTLKLWNVKTGALAATIRISHKALSGIAVNPAAPIVAVLEKIGLGTATVHVWDWKTGQRLFTVESGETPLFFAFSSQGHYLILGKPEIKSLLLYDVKTGKPVERFATGFGIVSMISMSKSDKTMMTYQPSGKLGYWDVTTEKQLAGYPKTTIRDLANIVVSDSKRFIAASTGHTLVIADLISGEQIARAEVGETAAIAISPDGKEIACISNNAPTSSLIRFSFDGNVLKRFDQKWKTGSIPELRDCAYAGTTLFLAAADGSLLTLPRGNAAAESEGPRVFAANRLLEISDITFSSGMLAASAGEFIITIPFSAFDDQQSDEEPAERPISFLQNPYRPQAGLFFLAPNKLCIWSNVSTPGGFTIYDTAVARVIARSEEFDTPLTGMSPIQKDILLIGKNGSIRVLSDPLVPRDEGGLTLKFDYTVQGVNAAVPVSRNILVGSRNKIGKESSALILIDSKTGETVPVPGPDMYCYALSFDVSNQRLYYIGVERENDTPATSLKYRHGKEFSSVTTLITYPGEDFTSSVVVANGTAYTSLGFGSIRTSSGKTVETFRESESLPRRLFVAPEQKFLFAVNIDRSVSAYSLATRGKLFDFYLFDDMEWVLVYPYGAIAASESGSSRVRTE